jgi:hypothetical protein
MMPSTKLPILAFEPPTPQPSQTGRILAHEEVNYVLPVQTSKPSAEPKPRTMMPGTKKMPFIFDPQSPHLTQGQRIKEVEVLPGPPTSTPTATQQPPGRTIIHGTKAPALLVDLSGQVVFPTPQPPAHRPTSDNQIHGTQSPATSKPRIVVDDELDEIWGFINETSPNTSQPAQQAKP